MASDMKKPLGITELWKADVPAKLWPLPVRAMHGIGEKTHDKLNRLNIYTIGDLAQADLSLLVKSLGDNAAALHQKANGLDSSPVTPAKREDMKSIGRSTTLAADAYSPGEIRLILMNLADDVGQTARKYNKKGAVIQVTLKFSDFKVMTRQMSVTPTFFTQDIFSAGMHLLNNHWPERRAVRLVGISLSGFDRLAEGRQLSLFDLQPDRQQNSPERLDRRHQQSRELDEVMDKIRNKYGPDKIGRASLIKKE